MIFGKKVIAWIPARGGSKGIPDKNIKKLNGIPLIAYSINAAKESKYVDDIIVSTDSDKIAQIAKKYGAEVPFIRPDELATDASKTIDAAIHTIRWLNIQDRKYDVFCLLQPTQPLRRGSDIDGALEKFEQNEERGLASISMVKDNPILIRTIASDGEMKNLLKKNSSIRRQDMPEYYRINGCIYLNKMDEVTNGLSFNDNPIPYIMNEEHSVDIDELCDFALAEYYIHKNK